MDTSPSRREFLAAGTAAGAGVLAPCAWAWEPSQRCPDPAIQILDPSFTKYRLHLAKVERLGTGVRLVTCEHDAVHAYGVVERGTRLANKRRLIDGGPGTRDGLRVDVEASGG